jgi:hypothetical protein
MEQNKSKKSANAARALEVRITAYITAPVALPAKGSPFSPACSFPYGIHHI